MIKQLLLAITLLLTGLNPALGAVGTSGWTYSFGHEPIEPKVLECGIIRPLRERHVLNGPLLIKHPIYSWVVAIEYDTDNDLQTDAIVFWAPGVTMARWYWFDVDFDSKVDAIFKDTKLDGSCDGVELEWNRTTLDDKPYSNNKKGDPIS